MHVTIYFNVVHFLVWRHRPCPLSSETAFVHFLSPFIDPTLVLFMYSITQTVTYYEQWRSVATRLSFCSFLWILPPSRLYSVCILSMYIHTQERILTGFLMYYSSFCSQIKLCSVFQNYPKNESARAKHSANTTSWIKFVWIRQLKWLNLMRKNYVRPVRRVVKLAAVG